MLQAMFSGVSGLQVHQTRLDVIGNNIANVNTIGFKSGRVTFSDQLSQTLRSSAKPSTSTGGQNASQVGLGVSLGAVDTLQTQGNLQTTGKPTDLAIQGNGFFLVSSGSNIYYTRDGSLDLDSDGVMVNPANGLKLLGYVADSDGNIDTSQQITSDSVIKVPLGTLTSVKTTTTSTLQGNLDAGAALQSTDLKITGNLDTSQVPPVMNSTVFDSLGNAHTVQLTFSNPTRGVGTSTQRWNVDVSVDGTALGTQKLYAESGKFVIEQPAGTQLGSTLTLNVNGSSGAPDFPLSLDFSGLSDTSSVKGGANGQASPTAIQSTLMNLTGNLNLDSSPVSFNTTVYDGSGNATTLTTTLTASSSSPSGPGVPTGATSAWDVTITKGATTLYDSTAAGPPTQAKAYYVPGSGFVLADTTTGASLGSTIQLVGAAPGSNNQGEFVASGFPLTVDLSGLSTSKTTGVADGLSGPSPIWNTSLRVYDSLGVSHLLNFKFTRALVGSGAPAAATARWEWAATENGKPVADSKTLGNSALFFDGSGNLINTKNQSVTVAPINGAPPFPVTVNFGTITQLAGDSSVAATTQDGFPVGTLQTFSISDGGLITGVFSNGQTRTLGQIATASFSNPAGLEKLGENLFSDSSNSGLAQIGLPAVSGRGKISTGFVEMSNVDLSTEFTNLIVTQRGFQANTRIITVVDELLQNVIDLKR